MKTVALTALPLFLLLACEKPPVEKPYVPRPVKMVDIGGGGAKGRVEYPGKVKSSDEAELSFDAAGKIIELQAKEGAPVKKGQVLARLDARDQQAALNASRAKLNAAKAEYERQRELYANNATSQQDLDVAKRNFEVTQADVQTARKAVEDTTLRAPFTGTVGKRFKENFENVTAKERVLLLVDRGSLEIRIDVPERDIGSGRAGGLDPTQASALMKPKAVITTMPDKEFTASLKEIASSADPTTRTFRATFTLEKSDPAILPGMTARVSLDLGALNQQAEGGGAVALPSQAVVAGDDGGTYVWVVDKATMKVSKRVVRVGKMSGDSVEVEDGLQSGETVAISGVRKLREGWEVVRYIPKSERKS